MPRSSLVPEGQDLHYPTGPSRAFLRYLHHHHLDGGNLVSSWLTALLYDPLHLWVDLVQSPAQASTLLCPLRGQLRRLRDLQLFVQISPMCLPKAKLPPAQVSWDDLLGLRLEISKGLHLGILDLL